ncbi:Protein FMP25, mitochondrial [Candida viswanathii]|uniref:Protein FMP25, mitochondrial n=1 Tax=Candida viswanathii TaxID=5486 RepID=A0A367XSV0_9ASCO|nr:Protein FMP25, mitochondrial [Candida viswanathii]
MILRVRRIPKVPCRITIPIRYKSSKDKYSSIEEFNKNKKTYNYGYNFDSLDKLDAKINPDHVSEKKRTEQRPYVDPESEKPMDINLLIENDPRLLKLKPGTAEYRDEMRKLHAEYHQKQQKQQKSHEFRQRMQGVIIGFLAFVGIISAHQILMNYDSIKNRLLMNYNYGDVKEPETKKKEVSTKSLNYMLEKLTKELSDEHLNQIQDSKEVTGVYVFGDDTKIPLRVPFFNNMIFKDVFVEKGHLVAITDKGKVYEWKKGWRDARLINLPASVDKVAPTDNYFYFLTNKGEVVYIPRNKSDKFVPLQRRNWFGLLKTQNHNELDVKNIKAIASGANHLLLLDKSGQVFVVNSSETPANRGQFGPIYSPFDKKDIPVNTPIDLTLLNNRIGRDGSGEKTLIPRTFSSIAAGKYFNLVADDEGNIWTWGENAAGQCGDLNTTQVKPIPRAVFAKSDLKRVLRNVLPLAKADLIQVKTIAAGDETSYAVINYLDKDILIAFGNGLNGQLGGSRYMQVCCWPEIAKSLINMTEFDESSNSIKPIGIKDISAGSKHLFITLDNVGQQKDVYAVGENILGQLGNGKRSKTCKPVKLPRLLEPEDKTDKLTIVQNLSDVNTKRLLLLDGWQISKNPVDQVIKAGDDASVIFYKKH